MAAKSKNPYLRKQGTTHEYTAEQIHELGRCMDDPIYFIENFVRIQHPSRGAVSFKLYDYQKKLIELYSNGDSILLSARQTGKCCIFTTKLRLIKLSSRGIINNIKKFILFIIDRRIYYDTFGKM